MVKEGLDSSTKKIEAITSTSDSSIKYLRTWSKKKKSWMFLKWAVLWKEAQVTTDGNCWKGLIYIYYLPPFDHHNFGVMYPFLNYTAYIHLLCSNCNLRWLFWRKHGLQRKLLLVTSLGLGAFFFNRTQIISKKCSRVLSPCNALKTPFGQI